MYEKFTLEEKDLRETFTRSRGPGGQNVNKVNSCVDLLHVPSQTRVKCDNSRSQELNRILARKLMKERLEELFLGVQSSKTKKSIKIQRQKARNLRRYYKSSEEPSSEKSSEEPSSG